MTKTPAHQWPEYTCIDCDSGDLTRQEARWHAHHEGHCVVKLDDE
jgi:hypothetical protein